MARYSRRTGPASDLTLTSSFVLIPGLTITRFYDDGELLIAFRGTAIVPGAGDRRADISVFIDGVNSLAGLHEQTITSLFRAPFSETFLFPIAQGNHTIELRARFVGLSGIDVLANTCRLTVIQLPQWDSDADIL